MKQLTRNLKEGDLISQDVSVGEKLILKKGTKMTLNIQERLKKWGVEEVQIQTAEEPVHNEQPNKKILSENPTRYESLFQESLSTVYSENRYGVALHAKTTIHRLKELFIKVMTHSPLSSKLMQLKKKDPHSFHHSFDVFVFGAIFSDYLKTGDQEDFATSCLFHDIGKLDVPDTILLKESKLTFKEYEMIKEHTINGEDTLRDHNASLLSQKMARSHHERLDGSGYPDGFEHLSDPEKIIGIIDVYSALTLDRVYRSAKPSVEALEIILESKSQFDPQLVYRFMNMLKIYPLHTRVLTSTNERAHIIYVSDKQPLTPIIQFENTDTVKQIPHNFSLSISRFLGWKEDYIRERKESNWALYMKSLFNADKRMAEYQFYKLIDDLRMENIYTEVFAASMKEVGQMYAEGKISIAEEHVATYMTKELMKSFTQEKGKEGNQQGKVLLTTVGKEGHSLPLELFSETLKINGWDTYNFTPSIPINELIHFAKINEIAFIGFSIIMKDNIPQLESDLHLIKTALPSVKILVGGPQIDEVSHENVDGFAKDATTGLRVITELRG
ncbi:MULTISPECIES: HD domain-containing phosphohydrolase [Pontibacillus]|uniref:HD domain-containing protein n=1 Tax=Pontibacillus chungwhensis TaxID=265426 RepID=A0ABY8UWB9_9BACI|nr:MULTISPECIES: HD domain-containing phosphohydrolase [Pontibacillus]MCD5324231.1 HD domain-containing protein [Pontibacillus sp. HN14]WIF97713.1 HD domain-containing protein [Pontibacillus chungwhensis]